ncbi:hypothetical protein GJ496_009474 [Pomphorhynchus laevis]|nr:hypothetical protein GJ496_009474 [Pomphorhynchus laevis]
MSRYFDTVKESSEAFVDIKRKPIKKVSFGHLAHEDSIKLKDHENVTVNLDNHKRYVTSSPLTDNNEYLAQENLVETKQVEANLSLHTNDKNRDISWIRANSINPAAVRTNIHKARIQRKNEQILKSSEVCATTEILKIQESGYVVQNDDADDICPYVSKSSELHQKDILKYADILTVSKRFDLLLEHFGPYSIDYTRNGRHLLLSGQKGHLAALDWQTKQLHFEINVMETIRDAKWLHNETFIAVAQKRWTYMYDKQGVEIHCLKSLDRVQQMSFLPYHFILVSLNSMNFLSFLDISTGKIINNFNLSCNSGKATMLTTNLSNGITLTGHLSGCVNLWSPNTKESLVTMLTHSSPLQSLCVDYSGNYLATTGVDRRLKIWDMRNYKLLSAIKLDDASSSLSFSQTGQLAISFRKAIKVYNLVNSMNDIELYMQHREAGTIRKCQFCPFEDVLGIGHSEGFSSILIPGSGESNFDAYEANPYQTKRQRRDYEVRSLLEKIPYELINIDNNALYEVDVESAVSNVDTSTKAFKKPKISAKKAKKLKKEKLSKRLVAMRKMREMAVQETVKSCAKKEKKKKPKTKMILMEEDPVFGRFRKL